MTGKNRKAAKAAGPTEQIRFGLGRTSLAALLVAAGRGDRCQWTIVTREAAAAASAKGTQAK
jgi:hypothetical protein